VPSGHYDLLYRAEPPVNVAPVVNYQYAMTSNYSPWDQGALPFDADPHLMSVPNLMVDPSFPLGAAPMPPAIQDPYAGSVSDNFYASTMNTQSHPAVASPVEPANLPLRTVSNKLSEGPQIRLNPLAMRPNLSHSLPVTAPFKK